MHKTAAGEKRKALKNEALEMVSRADELKAEAEALKETARLEDLTLWQMEKTKSTKKGSKTYLYWMVSWREGDKVRNVHLGSCRKMDHETALQKARKLKAESLAIQT
jgi:regulator of replication initiation timing